MFQPKVQSVLSSSQRKRQSPANDSKTDVESAAGMQFPILGWEAIGLIALFLCGFLTTTEGSELGHNLWLACAWLGFAALTLWLRSKVVSGARFRWTGQDAGVVLLITGHLLSGLFLFRGTGDVRAAINVMWQWVALGTLWFLLRIHLLQLSFRQSLLSATLVILTTLSLLGIWQNLIWFPQQAAAVQEYLDLEQAVSSGSSLSSEEKSRYAELSEIYGNQLGTLDSMARQSYLARIRDSIEPIGRFALANSFAGILLVGCLLHGFLLVSRFQNAKSFQRLIGIAAWVVITYCLILTKSRTATWVALPVGAIIIGLDAWRSDIFSRHVFRYAVVTGVAIVALLFLLAVFTGGLDAEAFSEAPKSLQYRLEYWKGTTQLLADRSILGVGPGNFRQCYLQYKLPGASEEVIDPHNLFLDIWANSGLLGLTGLLIFMLWTLLTAWQTEEAVARSAAPRNSQTRTIWSLLVAFSIVGFVTATLGGGFDQQLLALLACSVVLAAIIPPPDTTQPGLRNAALACWLALLIHLLASGGIEMPAIVQLLLLLAILSSMTTGYREDDAESILSPLVLRGLAAGFALLFVGCAWTAMIPVALSNASIELGQSAMMNPSYANRVQARRDFEAAIAADPIAPAPYQWLAQWYFADWNATSGTDDALFDQAIESQQAAIVRDPMNSSRHKLLGEFWDAKYQRSNVSEDAEQAVAAHQRSVELYPNDALRLSNLALALEHAGQDGSEFAEQALKIDDLNFARRHNDKTLLPSRRRELEFILEN